MGIFGFVADMAVGATKVITSPARVIVEACTGPIDEAPEKGVDQAADGVDQMVNAVDKLFE